MRYRFVGDKHYLVNPETKEVERLAPGAVVELTDRQYASWKDKFQPYDAAPPAAADDGAEVASSDGAGANEDR